MPSRRHEYQDVCWIASGQHGHVYKCIHLPSGKMFARKSLSTTFSPDARSQLVREMSVLMRAKCDKVLTFENIFINDDEVSLIVEYCPNGSLSDWLNTHGPLSESRLAFLAKETLFALQYMHKNFKLHHRDLKPSNMLLTKQGRLKIADFGECGGLLNTNVDDFGTLGYKAPECLDGEAGVDLEKADVWSLGVTLVEAAIGRFPYADLAAVELWETVKYEESPSLPKTFSVSARHFVDECLVKAPEKRASLEYLMTHPFLKKAANSLLD